MPERAYTGSGPLRSISFQQRPDVAVEFERPGSDSFVLLFDPKYKLRSEECTPPPEAGEEKLGLGSPRKMDIDKIHAYRDAIRNGVLRRVVAYAAILYPGKEVLYSDDIEALRAYPGDLEKLTLRLCEVLDRAIQRVLAG